MRHLLATLAPRNEYERAIMALCFFVGALSFLLY